MNFVHAFWSAPLYNSKFFDIKKGIDLTLAEYALSVQLVHEHGHTITLYTDNRGAKILDCIPYDEIIVCRNSITDNYHFAASFKFEALSRMKPGDILIDGDIMLHKDPVYKILEETDADILVSFFEPKSYIDNLKEKNSKVYAKVAGLGLPYGPYDYDTLDGWHNTSIMCFKNEDCKKAYIQQYRDSVAKVGSIDFEDSWPDLILEQVHLRKLCEANEWKLDMIAEGFPSDEANRYAISIGLLHLGAMKSKFQSEAIQLLRTKNPELLKTISERYKQLVAEMA